VVVIASLNERTLDGYPVELPWPGLWHEVFNSDYSDHFPNPWVAGNAGGVRADGPAGHIYPHTGRVTIPANGAVVLAREP
jgi:1,4-alpha-glucan branching enzyme